MCVVVCSVKFKMDRVVFKNFWIWFFDNGTDLLQQWHTLVFRRRNFVDAYYVSRLCFVYVARYQAFQIETATMDDT